MGVELSSISALSREPVSRLSGILPLVLLVLPRELGSRSLPNVVCSSDSVSDMPGGGAARRLDGLKSPKSSMFMKFWMPINPLAPPRRQLTPKPRELPGDLTVTGVRVNRVVDDKLEMSKGASFVDIGNSRSCWGG